MDSEEEDITRRIKATKNKDNIEVEVPPNRLKEQEVQCSLRKKLCIRREGAVLQNSKTNCGLFGRTDVKPKVGQSVNSKEVPGDAIVAGLEALLFFRSSCCHVSRTSTTSLSCLVF